MGNAYSTEPPAHRDSHRLTKPRTYNHSSSPKIGASPQSSKSSSFDPDDVVWTSAGSLRSKQEARQQIRMQLFGPHEEEALFHREATAPSDHGSSALDDLAANINDRLTLLSRSGTILSNAGGQRSSTMQSNSAFGASNLSLEPEKRTIDLEAAIGILQELKKTATPEQLVALHKALLPTRDEPAAVDTNNQAPRKLVRQRSLAVPGLATRNPFDVLRKQDDDDAPTARSSSPVEEQPHLWKMDELGSSPLSKIASLDVPQGDRADRRAQTPGDVDYATLSNKIGRLTITNGAPSPAPSIISRHLDRRGSLPELHQDEFFAFGSDDHDDTEDEHSDSPLPRRFHTFGPSSGYAELDAASTEIPKMLRRSRMPSELMLNGPPDHMNSDDDKGHRPASKLSKLSAEEYIAELESSPYGQSPFSRATPSPRPPEDDSDEGYYGQHDPNMYRAEALRILDGNSAVAALPYDEKIPVEQSSEAASNTGFKRSLANDRLQRPAQAPHSDSGYSSGTSLEAVRRWKPQASEEDGTAAYSTQREDICSYQAVQAMPSASDSRQHGRVVDSSVDATDVQNSYITGGMAEENKENSKQKMAVVTKAETKVETKAETKAETKGEWRRSLRRSKSWKRLSLKAITSPSPSPSPGTPEPTESKEQSSEPPKPTRHDSAIEQKTSEKNESQPTRRKLQKRKSAAVNPTANPTVQNNKPIKTGSIPDVPGDLSAGFSKRIEDSPGMDHLEHTCVSQNDAAEQSGVPISLPSSEPAEDARDTISSLPQQNSKKKRSSKSTRSPSPLKYALSFRRKSKEVSTRQEESDKSSREATPTPTPPAKPSHQEKEVASVGPTISDFGTVAQSLGGSPYDIALSSMSVKPQVSASSAVQPHHFSTNMIAPANSSRNMDAATASEFARVRSKDRALAFSEKRQEEHDQQQQEEHQQKPDRDPEPDCFHRSRNSSRARPISYHDHNHQQMQREQEQQRSVSGSSVRNFSRPQSVAAKPSSTGYNSSNSSTTDLGNNERPLPPVPSKNPNKPAYRPYRRGLLIKSYSQSTAPSLTRAATFDIREEKIPVEDMEDEDELPTLGLQRRHTEDLRPRTAEEKMVVELEDALALADAKREEDRRERELPPSLRIQTRDWEQTSKIWRERREAFRSRTQSQERPPLPRSLSVQYPRTQDQGHNQPPRMKLHVRAQSQQAMHRQQPAPSHSHSQSSSAASSAKASPSVSPAWSPIPQAISSADKQPLPPNPFAAASAASRTKKRSSIQRYYTTKNKSNPLQNGKTSVESVAEE